ncbi:MAG: sialidase family protein [Verrucomicrobiia bacterium]
MKPQQRITRRKFLGATAATAGGMMIAATRKLNAATDEFPSNDHFWYRPQPAGPYIDSQCDNRAFGHGDGQVMLSEDNGRTWPHRIAFPEEKHITFSHILKNGNVLFSTREKLFLSTDKLKTIQPITVKDANGADYLPHTPKNPNNPGWYFHTLAGVISWDVNGREMMVWGNYCNVVGGAVPVNIYYSTDSGRTVKIAYAFGQNPHFHDNGSPGGGKTGTVLGNPDSSLLCRHVHTVAYNPPENAFYACTGDINRGAGLECHWLRGTYDEKKDKWQWKLLISVDSNSRYKCGGINFVDGKCYWISDANAFRPWNQGDYDRGIFCCDPADITKPEKHTMLFNPKVESGNMIIQDGVILASHCAPASSMKTGIIVSLDMGKTWAQYDLKEFGPRSATRFHAKNSEGWFRMDLRKGWIDYAEAIFIKPKPRVGGGK